MTILITNGLYYQPIIYFSMLAKITALAVLSVLFTLGGSAYAETATVEVPFTSHGSTCSFDELAVEFH